MEDIYLTIVNTALLLGTSERNLRKTLKSKKYKVIEIENNVGGKSGIIYNIALSSLPAAAQIKYYQELFSDEDQQDLDFGFNIHQYKDRYGEEGLKEFINKLVLIREIEKWPRNKKNDMQAKYEDLAIREGVSARTLYRWYIAYKENGPVGLCRKIERSDKNERRSICHAAMDYVALKYLREAKPAKKNVFEMLTVCAEERGSGYCEHCIHNAGTDEREAALERLPSIKLCDEPIKEGMIITKSYQTLARIIAEDIPEAVTILGRLGAQEWKKTTMIKATREKPSIINEIWYGDHHELDIFVLDMYGKPVRPWLTSWYDIASGCMVGYCLNVNPNSWTIAKAFVNAVAHKKDNQFYGLPRAVYIDNGKDYRSNLFDGNQFIDKKIGKIDYNIETRGMMAQLNVETHFATPYYAWVKPIERLFSTIEEKYLREQPGWCGNSPGTRPASFDLKKLHNSGVLLTLDELHKVFVEEILPYYHSRPHSGYNKEIPSERYDRLPRARNDQPSPAVLMIVKMEADERRVRPDGIHFDKKVYWHDEFRHLVGEYVTIKFDRYEKDELIVIHNGHFVCVAVIKELFRHLGEDPEKIAHHRQLQSNQYHETQEKIAYLTGGAAGRVRKQKKATVNTQTFEETDNTGSSSTVIDYEKATTSLKKAKDSGKKKAEPNMFRERYKAIGAALINNSSHEE